MSVLFLFLSFAAASLFGLVAISTEADIYEKSAALRSGGRR